MSIARGLTVAVGIGSLCVALAVSFSPSLEGVIHWPWDDQLLLDAFFTVALVGACALVPFVLFGERQAEHSERPDEPPESVPIVPSPGHDLEGILDHRWPASLPLARRQRVRARFRRAAMRTIVRTDDCTTETARERLERGSWTDDPVARAFVSREFESRSETESTPESAAALVRSLAGRVLFPWRAQRTARAILALAEEDGEEEEEEGVR